MSVEGDTGHIYIMDCGHLPDSYCEYMAPMAANTNMYLGIHYYSTVFPRSATFSRAYADRNDVRKKDRFHNKINKPIFTIEFDKGKIRRVYKLINLILQMRMLCSADKGSKNVR